MSTSWHRAVEKRLFLLKKNSWTNLKTVGGRRIGTRQGKWKLYFFIFSEA
jgi:hypothetical protein